jgi:DNA invertase Pin-like site-specific DNA recombinase
VIPAISPEVAHGPARAVRCRRSWADTDTGTGRLMLTILGGLAEFERELIRARTNESRACAKAGIDKVADQLK